MESCLFAWQISTGIHFGSRSWSGVNALVSRDRRRSRRHEGDQGVSLIGHFLHGLQVFVPNSQKQIGICLMLFA